MSSAEKKCVTPRGHGDGDGIRPYKECKKRVPISSARKFNARTPLNEPIKLKLKSALDEMYGSKKQCQLTPSKQQRCLLKSASVAEITPTTTRTKRRSSYAAPEDSCELYATPRPLDDAPKVRFCQKERSKCRLYKRLILLAWRRTRASVLASSELLKKQGEQIGQLEMQVGLLNELRVSESQKRDESLVECQKLRKAIGILELENSQLSEETQNLQHTLEHVQNEVKMVKCENNLLSEKATKMQEIIGKKNTEKRSLEDKVRLQEQDITFQKVTIRHFEEKLETTAKNLKNVESNYRTKEKKYANLKCEFKKQLDTNDSLSTQLQLLIEEKNDISNRVENMESQLNEYIQSCEILRDANAELTQEIEGMSVVLEEEQKQTWIKNTKQLALLSLSALHKVAYIMLPAYLDAPQY